MLIKVGDILMHPAYAPYPWYGRVVKLEDGARVLVTQVHCGDPRCNAEHVHTDEVWQSAEVLSVRAYQPRATWELGRKSSQNAPALP